MSNRTGIDILRDPFLNKGTTFTAKERDTLKLRGLLPPRVHSTEEQMGRVLSNLRGKATNLERYVFLNGLLGRNVDLFYRLALENIEEIMPLIYTPTVGKACQEYGSIFRRPNGLYISLEDAGHIEEILQNWPHKDVRVIVVTDGERILGLGDLGSNGMGIPVGKLSLYTACAGIHPSQTLPITIDVGTENPKLLADPLYLGLQQHRVRGEAYDALIAEFMKAAQKVFPNILIQFEDFANQNAFRLLEHYQDKACTFNDDIQGTASVALAGLYSALRVTGGKMEEQRLLFFGAGEAGTGIAELAVEAMVKDGVPEAKALARCWFIDSKGLVTKGRPGLAGHKLRFAVDHAPLSGNLEIVEALKPTAIIGVSGQPNTFTKEILKKMAEYNARPIVFALSNPTSQAECTAEQAYVETDGKAVFASGSPFDPVTFKGQTFVPGQGNNAYIFPGVGLGVVAVKSRRVNSTMFLTAAKTLAQLVSEEDLAKGRIYPSLKMIRKVSLAIAVAVAEVAYAQGLADEKRPADLSAFIQAKMYQP